MSWPALVEITNSSRCPAKSSDKDSSHIFLRGSGWRSVIVRKVEMGDTAVESAVHDPAAFLEIIDVAEVVPEAERNRGQQKSGIATSPVRHAAVIAGGVEHGT